MKRRKSTKASCDWRIVWQDDKENSTRWDVCWYFCGICRNVIVPRKSCRYLQTSQFHHEVRKVSPPSSLYVCLCASSIWIKSSRKIQPPIAQIITDFELRIVKRADQKANPLYTGLAFFVRRVATKSVAEVRRISFYCVCILRRYCFKTSQPTSILFFSSHKRKNNDLRLWPNVSGSIWNSGFSLWHSSNL